MIVNIYAHVKTSKVPSDLLREGNGKPWREGIVVSFFESMEGAMHIDSSGVEMGVELYKNR